MTVSTPVVVGCLIILFLLVPICILFFTRNKKVFKIMLGIFMSLFAILLVCGVLGSVDITNNTTTIGIDFSGGWFSKTINTSMKTTRLDKIINLFMLVPVGECVGLISKKNNIKCGFFLSFIFGLLIGCTIEFFQFMLPVSRSVQLSDVVFNTLSSMIGYLYISVIFLFLETCALGG